jgi:formylglycine-generating enzyme
MRTAWSVAVVVFLIGFVHMVFLALATPETDGKGVDEVDMTANPTDLPEASVEAAPKSRFVPNMPSQVVIQLAQQTPSAGTPHYRNPKDGYEMILIPGGEAIFGTGPDDPYYKDSSTDKEKPQFKADIPEFLIGAYCVTNEQYLFFVKETGHRPPDHATWGTPVWQDGKFPEEKRNHPVVCVSWHDAKAYCEWAGLSLPTDLQWEKAARGFDGRIYPWGNQWDEGKLRNYKNKGLGTTCAVDDYREGTSVFRVFNMSGNAWEWCEDWYEDNVYERYARGDSTVPTTGNSKILRGGSWHGDEPLPFRCAARISKDPEDRASVTGVRCARGL